jgi:ADP-ribose pyrophosphatase YjhB (NUDIX family)
MPELRVPCVGAIITDPAGRLLLIKRGHEPEAGRWSLPGGRIEPGESDEQALVREVREETGLTVTVGRLIGSVDRPQPDGRVLVIRDYAAEVTGGDLTAGDDAAGARWVSLPGFDGLPLTTGLEEALSMWGVTGLAPATALIAEATRRTGVIWLTVPPSGTAFPVWHIWRTAGDAGPGTADPPPGAAYLVTGPGEQPAPGLAAAGRVRVTVPSKQSGGALVTWTAAVHRVDPGSAEWDAVIGALAAGRLNAVLGPGEVSPADRWARSGTVFCLAPVAQGT